MVDGPEEVMGQNCCPDEANGMITSARSLTIQEMQLPNTNFLKSMEYVVLLLGF